jgi:hypothetical protein
MTSVKNPKPVGLSVHFYDSPRISIDWHLVMSDGKDLVN